MPPPGAGMGMPPGMMPHGMPPMGPGGPQMPPPGI
jgi:hypothetical protein